MTVTELAEAAAARGLRIDSFRVGPRREVRTTAPGTWHVLEVGYFGRTKLIVWAGPERAEPGPWYLDAQARCPKG
jgi:hypothetical protein